MSNVLNIEDKKYLRKVCRYLGSLGMDSANIEFDIDYGSFDCEDINWQEISHFSNNYTAEIPDGLIPILQKILNYVCENDLIESPDVDNMNWERLEIDIYCKNGEISVSYDYGYYDAGDTTGFSWELGEDEDEDETIKGLFNDIESEVTRLPTDGVLVLEYNGGGDSGYLDDNFTNRESVPASVSDWAYRILEYNHGGWEINEGSQGKFYFDTNNSTIQLEHTYNVDETKRDTLFEEKF